jgi:hypothetical protein
MYIHVLEKLAKIFLSEKKLKNTSLEDRQVLDTDNEDESGH